MPVQITIIAKMNGRIFFALIEQPHLKWEGVDRGAEIIGDVLPEQIYEITVSTAHGGFRQVFPTVVIDSSPWERLVRWWKGKRYG